MNKRQLKKYKNKKLLLPALARRENGFLAGYTCPTCGNRHVKEPYCRCCNQMLIYNEGQRKSAPAVWEKVSLERLYKSKKT